MSFADIEAELPNLAPGELRTLAMKSWITFVKKEQASPSANECSEEDSEILAALDEAVAGADANPDSGKTADDVRARLKRWTSK